VSARYPTPPTQAERGEDLPAPPPPAPGVLETFLACDAAARGVYCYSHNRVQA
jgi:hypothetical protein